MWNHAGFGGGQMGGYGGQMGGYGLGQLSQYGGQNVGFGGIASLRRGRGQFVGPGSGNLKMHKRREIGIWNDDPLSRTCIFIVHGCPLRHHYHPTPQTQFGGDAEDDDDADEEEDYQNMMSASGTNEYADQGETAYGHFRGPGRVKDGHTAYNPRFQSRFANNQNATGSFRETWANPWKGQQSPLYGHNFPALATRFQPVLQPYTQHNQTFALMTNPAVPVNALIPGTNQDFAADNDIENDDDAYGDFAQETSFADQEGYSDMGRVRGRNQFRRPTFGGGFGRAFAGPFGVGRWGSTFGRF